ncbi:MAG: acyl-CoA thioesterase [Thermodesulfobacteriota bacterium]
MLTHRITYRVIYGDTDRMGVAYHANYLRWFEMGRTELFRHVGLAYRDIEDRGVLLPVSEAYCKYLASARYDDMLAIETTLDPSVRAGMKFDYVIYRDADQKSLVKGYTKHACTTHEGKVIRPPKFLIELIARFGGDA